jgi:ABC-type multidrug transport system fused ATPase/permease subunit
MNKAPPRSPLGLLVWSLRPYRGAVIVVALLSVLTIAGNVALPLLIGRAIDRITLGLTEEALLTAGAIALLGVFVALAIGARGIIAGRLSIRVEHSLRYRLYAHLHAVEPEVLDRRSTGEWVSIATLDLIPISTFVGLYLAQLATSTLTLVAAAAVMFVIDPLLALLALATVPLTILSLIRYRATARPLLAAVRQRMGELTGLVDENIGGAAVIRASAREAEEMRRFDEASRHVLDEALAANRRLALFTPSAQVLPNVGSALVVVIGGLMAIQGHLSVVSFTVFYTYLVMLVPSIQSVGTIVGQAQQALACAERVADTLASPVERGLSTSSVPEGPAAVDLDEVSVQAADGRTIIEGADLHARAGGTIAIVGATGSGKSVLMHLLNRLTHAASGSVRIADLPVEEIELGSLRHAVSPAGADEFLFAGTIAENIEFGRPDASREEVEAAARVAQAHDFIVALPDGYETRLGDRGAGLSGGQRQRVALARALLARAGLLLLDNATGSLDALTEAAAVKALEERRREQPFTKVIVGYRPALLRAADEVLVIEDGHIIDRGTHAELEARSERYRELVGSE